MELKLKPYHKDLYPLGGVLVKGSSAAIWLGEIQQLGLRLSDISVYPIGGKTANSIWGCLIRFPAGVDKLPVGRNSYCQLVATFLFIPEKSVLYPTVSDEELEKLFASKPHVLHPEFGLVALEKAVDWAAVIEKPIEQEVQVIQPAAAVFIPAQIRTFQIKPQPPEEAMASFEEEHFPKPQKFKDKPLNLFEKGKHLFYQLLFTKGVAAGKEEEKKIMKTRFLTQLESLRKRLGKREDTWTQNLQLDYEALEKRNAKQLDRLLRLLKENPQEALQYAIPLDKEGTGRGGYKGAFSIGKQWWDFSLFGTGATGSGGGTALLPDDAFMRLQKEYRQTAQDLLRQKDYQKAAFVYLKLLKDFPAAAETLEKGHYYAEAASVYLKYCKNKEKAAACYEKGNLVSQAIELYMELNQEEKVGDLYCLIDKREVAFSYYEKVAQNHIRCQQYVKAALLYKNKMAALTKAQGVLLEGWHSGKDAFNCLSFYLSNMEDQAQRRHALETIVREDVHERNRIAFIQILKQEYAKGDELATRAKEMAYELVVAQVALNPSIVTELAAFNKEDRQLLKDLVRFKVQQKKR